MAKIGLIGAGSWGTALSKLAADNGHQVTVWSIVKEEIEMLRKNREHLDKLPGVKLPESISYTTELPEAIEGMDLCILAVPSPFTRNTAALMKPFVKEGQIIVNVAKGVEEKTLMTLSEIIEEEILQADVAVLSGPSHAEEVGKGMPTTIVAGAKTKKTAEYIQNLLMNKAFRVYTSPDLLGIELGGALKNVIALAAGIADGLGCGDNTKAALITRGITEIGRLGLAMGEPVFVTEIRPEANQVVIGGNEDVFGTTLYANRLNFMSVPDLDGEKEVMAKIRYNHQGAPCLLQREEGDRVACRFKEPVRAITPGQAVVFYEGDVVVGGGTILSP